MSDGSESSSKFSEPNPAVTETDGKSDDCCSTPPATATHGAASYSPPEHDGPASEPPQARVSRNDAAFAAASTEELTVRVSSEGDDGSAGKDRERAVERFPGSDSKSLLMEFDEYVAAERNSAVASRDLEHGFEVGDLVWGKVKSHPWWPGHIYNEAFATPAVRRSRREGHVLVAFFGDNSYGWFEPEELIPFDPNFAEKSQQTNSRTFVKAVEEAVDEASRRRGLGLVCRCRKPDNFRPTNVQDYFSVDVPDYEPQGFYSESEIRKARDGFEPSKALDFVKQLALAPHDQNHGSIGFIMNKATASAYRKAVFEQYDETYAQAFGVQPSRPPQNVPLHQPVRQPSRAPLSGPLVIAEALGGGKSAKSGKVKDNLKKDKYLFKRRDDQSNSFQVAYREETPDAAGCYVFQKRTPSVPVMPHNLEKSTDAGFISHDIAASTSDRKEALIGQVQADGRSLTSQAVTTDAKPHLDKGKESSDNMTHMFERDSVTIKNMGRSDLLSTVDERSQSSHLENKISVDGKHDENAKVSGPSDDINQTEQGLPTVFYGGNGMHPVKSENNVNNSLVKAKHLKNTAVKKIKGLKRPADDLNSVISTTGERKKKKKKDLNLQPMSGHLEKHSTKVKPVHLPGKPGTTDLAPREGFRTEQVQADVNARNLLPMDTLEDVNFEVPQILGDLQALALDPSHGCERKISANVRQFFLRFRSLYYQKSLVLSPPIENETPEVRVTKSHSNVRISDSPDGHVRASPPVKAVKHIVRPDDPTKAGRKRGPSDRQEEIAAKRLKKMKDLKALAVEKAAFSQRASEARREDGKESQSQAPSKLVRPESHSQAPSKFLRPDSAKKVNRPSKTVDPTTLVIKFPPQTSLPSVAELKARFARFGPMDQSGFRVFWKSLTCRVVFLHKADALAAYKYSVANQSLFGSGGVRCFLRESEDSAPEVSEAARVRGDDGASEIPRVKDPAAAHRQTSQQPLPQPVIPLKSCLKKSTGDEPGQVAGNGSSSSSSKGNPRVKFMLGGEESSKGEQLMVGNKNFNNASFADGGAMDFNSKNVQKVITSQPPSPIIPLATKNPQHNLRNFELAMAPRNNPNFINTTTSTTTTTTSATATPPVDISQQMITLLTRCSDVVTNLTGLLGYAPYHPL